ncbi:MAG: peptidoglycan-associated lipoprotein Pal [Deltaproteobacteria bacterium]|nr:peptidoglycan-associated lipoprotein Pal [Deltaproteobacteria bacterium]TLN04418.1 MAG: peptidoglycan-associated lipoprotein Pal [bacterium]
MKKWSMYCCVLFAVFAFLAAGCTKRSTIPDEELVPDKSSTGTIAGSEDSLISSNEAIPYSDESESADAAKAKTTLVPVYFDFDSWVLSGAAREAIQKNYEWMKANQGTKISIEGHTDERGSDSYNLALGENRAKSVMKYVITLGADPSRVSIISYGEENPADPGHNEQAWAKNRRAEFVVQ